MGLSNPIDVLLSARCPPPLSPPADQPVEPAETSVGEALPVGDGEELSVDSSQLSVGEVRNPNPDFSPDFSADQQRDLCVLVDLLHCPVRRSILLSLASCGPANVTTLTTRTQIAHNTLSQHLAHLRNAGLVFGQRKGKEIWYETTEDRVIYTCGEQTTCGTCGGQMACGGQQSDAIEKFSLTITARGGGVSVTIAVGNGAT